MSEHHDTSNRRRARRAGLIGGTAAVAAMAAFAVTHGGAPTSSTLAGSGDAPVLTYAQPTVGGMNLGATATWSPPGSTLETSMAVPAIKAGG